MPAAPHYEAIPFRPFDARLEEYRAPNIVALAQETQSGQYFTASMQADTAMANSLADQAEMVPHAMVGTAVSVMLTAVFLFSAIKNYKRSSGSLKQVETLRSGQPLAPPRQSYDVH